MPALLLLKGKTVLLDPNPHSAKPRLDLRLSHKTVFQTVRSLVSTEDIISLCCFLDTDHQLPFKIQKGGMELHSQIDSLNYSTINTPYDLEIYYFVQETVSFGYISIQSLQTTRDACT